MKGSRRFLFFFFFANRKTERDCPYELCQNEIPTKSHRTKMLQYIEIFTQPQSQILSESIRSTFSHFSKKKKKKKKNTLRNI